MVSRALGRRSLAISLAIWAAPALAGPPYETDDPEPTDVGHYEIYAFATLDGPLREGSGAAGLDVNYGALKNVQLTATLPVSYVRNQDRRGWATGAGDMELGVKFRFFNREDVGLSASMFPRVVLPTGRAAFGTGRTRFLLPLWVKKDIGHWSIFGGGGFEFNPGVGNRDFLTAGLAVSHDLEHGVSIGGEVTHQGSEAVDAFATTSLGVGSIIKVGGPYAVLISGGPTFQRGKNGYHAYAALGVDF